MRLEPVGELGELVVPTDETPETRRGQQTRDLLRIAARAYGVRTLVAPMINPCARSLITASDCPKTVRTCASRSM